MRISSGFAKGLELKVPEGLATRPTSAKVRAAVLNALQADLPEAEILELFAGSGALSIEAVSRGALGAVLVERNRAAVQCLQKNVAELQRRADAQKLARPEVHVQAQDVGDYLGKVAKNPSFDIVLVDPPYQEAVAWFRKLLGELPPLLKTNNQMVFESEESAEEELNAELAKSPKWQLLKQKHYGGTLVSTLCYNHE